MSSESRDKSEPLREEDVQGLKKINKLGPLLERLRDVGCQRDKAGNRQLFMDQDCALVLLPGDHRVPAAGAVDRRQGRLALPGAESTGEVGVEGHEISVRRRRCTSKPRVAACGAPWGQVKYPFPNPNGVPHNARIAFANVWKPDGIWGEVLPVNPGCAACGATTLGYGVEPRWGSSRRAAGRSSGRRERACCRPR
jgi:hypothetical protein